MKQRHLLLLAMMASFATAISGPVFAQDFVEPAIVRTSPQRYWAKEIVFQDRLIEAPSGKTQAINDRTFYSFRIAEIGAGYADQATYEKLKGLRLEQEYLFTGTVLERRGKYYVVVKSVDNLFKEPNLIEEEIKKDLVRTPEELKRHRKRQLMVDVMNQAQASMLLRSRQERFEFKEYFNPDSPHSDAMQQMIQGVVASMEREGRMSATELLSVYIRDVLSDHYMGSTGGVKDIAIPAALLKEIDAIVPPPDSTSAEAALTPPTQEPVAPPTPEPLPIAISTNEAPLVVEGNLPEIKPSIDQLVPPVTPSPGTIIGNEPDEVLEQLLSDAGGVPPIPEVVVPAPEPTPPVVTPEPEPPVVTPAPVEPTPAPEPTPEIAPPAPEPTPPVVTPEPEPPVVTPAPVEPTPVPEPTPEVVPPAPEPTPPVVTPEPEPPVVTPAPVEPTPVPEPTPEVVPPAPVPSPPVVTPEPEPPVVTPAPVEPTPVPEPTPEIAPPAPEPTPPVVTPAPVEPTPAPEPTPEVVPPTPEPTPPVVTPEPEPPVVTPAPVEPTPVPEPMPEVVPPAPEPTPPVVTPEPEPPVVVPAPVEPEPTPAPEPMPEVVPEPTPVPPVVTPEPVLPPVTAIPEPVPAEKIAPPAAPMKPIDPPPRKRGLLSRIFGSDDEPAPPKTATPPPTPVPPVVETKPAPPRIPDEDRVPKPPRKPEDPAATPPAKKDPPAETKPPNKTPAPPAPVTPQPADEGVYDPAVDFHFKNLPKLPK